MPRAKADKKRKIKLSHRLVRMLELPDEAIKDVPKVTVLAGDRCLVENHRGVAGISPECVCLYMSAGLIRIGGHSLVIGEVNSERLYISGDIRSVNFEYAG